MGSVRVHSARLHERRTWDGIVLESIDVPELEREVDGRLTVGSVEGAIFGRVLIEAELDVESLLDVGDGSGHRNDHAVASGLADDLQAVLFREADDGIVLILGGAKARGEFF